MASEFSRDSLFPHVITRYDVRMKALIVVDYQVDFVTGALGFAGAEEIEGSILRLIEEYEGRGDDVLFTLDTHEDDYMKTEEGKNLPVPHCIKNSEGWQLYGKIKEAAKGHPCFEKPTFGSAELLDYLRKKNYEEVALCGLDTSICVISNAVIAKAALPNAHIVCYAKASGSGDKEAEAVALKQFQRIHVEIR